MATAAPVASRPTVWRRARESRAGPALFFLAPAVVLLLALVVYPIVATVVFSFQDRTGSGFVGLSNYRELFTNPRILTAVRNSLIWVVVVPAFVTAIGLVFAVLTERVSYAAAVKAVVFMPMAISLLAGGVIWRVVYDENPDRGLLNAAMSGAAAIFQPPGAYAGVAPSEGMVASDGAIAFATDVRPGESVSLGLLRVSTALLPEETEVAEPPGPAGSGEVRGVVFRDFTPGTEGVRGQVDPGELGIPGVVVEVRDATGSVAGTAITDEAGSFVVDDLADEPYRVVLAASNFRGAFQGVRWLGPTLITPAIILAYVWIWAGFAMVVIGAGLAAIEREVLEAARVDGASEWQTFRFVTVPLLAPVLVVVLVTLVINVLKVFDIVLVLAPSAVQDDANVIALEMWRTAFGARNLGLGSAVAVLLFAMVIPIMALNIRRFRAER